MSFTITLTTTDGASRTVGAVAGQSVVEAAAEAGTIIPSLCGKGSCGTCVGRVDGPHTVRPFEAEALGATAGNDAVLLCCCEPAGDLTVRLPFDESRLIDTAPAERRATITALDHLTDDVVRLRMQLADDPEWGTAAQFEAGQFMQLEVPETGELRAYSMSNVANWDGQVEFMIHLRPGGAMSEYLRSRAQVGDELRAVGPQGTFGLAENGMRPRWFVGGGCGVAPLLSMLRRMAEWGDPQPARLFLGVNSTKDVFAREEIDEISGLLPDFDVTVAIWKADPSEDLAACLASACAVPGSAVDALVEALPAVEEMPDIYVCGPPAMVTALEREFAQREIPFDQVHTERIAQN